jgi:hypothetical protein
VLILVCSGSKFRLNGVVDLRFVPNFIEAAFKCFEGGAFTTLFGILFQVVVIR